MHRHRHRRGFSDAQNQFRLNDLVDIIVELNDYCTTVAYKTHLSYSHYVVMQRLKSKPIITSVDTFLFCLFEIVAITGNARCVFTISMIRKYYLAGCTRLMLLFSVCVSFLYICIYGQYTDWNIFTLAQIHKWFTIYLYVVNRKREAHSHNYTCDQFTIYFILVCFWYDLDFVVVVV